MCPVSQPDRHDAPGLFDEAIPGIAAVIDDIVVRAEDAVGQPVVAHELPQVLDRVQFRALWRQWHERDVIRQVEAVGHVPAGLVEDNNGMRAGRNCGSDLGDMQVHRFGVAGGHDESRALPLLWADGTEDVGRGCPLVMRGRGSRPTPCPASSDLVLLADARLVGEPDLYPVRVDALVLCDCLQTRREAFLKFSMAPSAWA